MQLTNSGVVVTCDQCSQRNRLKFEKLGESFRCGKCQTEINPPNHPLDVEDEAAFLAVVERSALPILVDCWAPWCGPCKMVAPEVAKFATDAKGRILVLKVNTENSPMLAQRYQISGIPTFLLFKSGQIVARQSGAMSAHQLKSFVSSAA